MGMHQPIEIFDPQKVAEMVFGMTKVYTESSMEIMKTSMEQVQNVLDTLLKQDDVIHDKAQKLFADWMNQAKQGQQQYWNMMEENIKKMESFFNSATTKKE